MLFQGQGIYLLKDGVSFPPIGAADFRTRDIPFDMILKSLGIMIADLPFNEKNNILAQWHGLRDRLENTERRQKFLPTMDLEKYPKSTAYQIPPLPDSLAEHLEGPEIRGNVLDEAVVEGSLDDISVGDDVVVYTRLLSKRPWVGRVSKLLPDEKFEIHWFVKEGKRKIFNALMNSDGSKSLDVLGLDVIMFSNMSERKQEKSFFLSNYWLEVFDANYKEIDRRENL